MRQIVLFAGVILFFCSCTSSPGTQELSPDEENRRVLDKGDCNEKADQFARGFGKGGITWERKRQEIYDNCMKNKGWEKE